MKIFKVEAVSVQSGHVYRRRFYVGSTGGVNAFRGYWNNRHGCRVDVKVLDVDESDWRCYDKGFEALIDKVDIDGSDLDELQRAADLLRQKIVMRRMLAS